MLVVLHCVGELVFVWCETVFVCCLARCFGARRRRAPRSETQARQRKARKGGPPRAALTDAPQLALAHGRGDRDVVDEVAVQVGDLAPRQRLELLDGADHFDLLAVVRHPDRDRRAPEAVVLVMLLFWLCCSALVLRSRCFGEGGRARVWSRCAALCRRGPPPLEGGAHQAA